MSWPVRIDASANGLQNGSGFWGFSWTDDSWPAVPVSFGPGQQISAGTQRTVPVVLFEALGGWQGGGKVRDASTGELLGQVMLRLRAGWGAPNEEQVVFETASDSNGEFSLTVDQPGMYTVEAVAPAGYSRSIAPFRMGPNSPVNQLVLLSPAVPSGAMRASLVWRSSARDLDLHVSGPLAGEAGRYQVYAEDTPHPIYGEPIAEVEALEGTYETIAVNTLRSGVYRVSAFDKDNSLAESSTALGEAHATLLMWTEEDCVMESLGPDAVGNLWRGLEYHTSTEDTLRLQEMDEGRNDWDVTAF